MIKYKEQLENCKKCKNWPGHPCKECDIIQTLKVARREADILHYAFSRALSIYAHMNAETIVEVIRTTVADAQNTLNQYAPSPTFFEERMTMPSVSIPLTVVNEDSSWSFDEEED